VCETGEGGKRGDRTRSEATARKRERNNLNRNDGSLSLRAVASLLVLFPRLQTIVYKGHLPR